ncbi:MAG: biotin attachment protein, partial [Thermoflexibacteraceae bacterium]
SMQAGIGEVIKEGDAVVSIMPDSPQIAVELYVKAMDVPLLSLGRHARIEFDGWPAIQFSGWPSIAVGTFGGEVAVIDQVDSKEGKYRILIKPDETDDAWPERLRQGSGARGWVMLDDVQVWFEIWRQLNGFPPTLQNQPDDLHFGDKSKGGKGDKDEKES